MTLKPAKSTKHAKTFTARQTRQGAKTAKTFKQKAYFEAILLIILGVLGRLAYLAGCKNLGELDVLGGLEWGSCFVRAQNKSRVQQPMPVKFVAKLCLRARPTESDLLYPRRLAL